jgi:hypothetical protein
MTHRTPLSIELPDRAPLTDRLWLPVAPGRHPATDDIAPAHQRWLARHGLLEASNAHIFEQARFHDLAGRVYHAGDATTLRLAADFIAALFVLDDLMDTALDPACRDEAQARLAVEQVRRAAHTGRGPDGPRRGVTAVAAAMADLTRRLAAGEAPLGPYLREVDVYLNGVIEETRRRSAGFRSVADYAEVRVAFSAVYACVELGLAARGAVSPPRPLARLANLSVSWVNDVYSWPKERALGERSNLVAVLMDTAGMTEDAAFHRACRLCDGVVRAYRQARAPLADTPALGLLEGWMRGNLDWHAVGTARYTAHLSVAPLAA